MMSILRKPIVRLLLAVVIGIVIGMFLPEGVMGTVMTIKQLCGQVIFFLVPLIILGFVAPSIAQLQNKASQVLLVAFGVAYASSVCAGFFSAFLSYEIVPWLSIEPSSGNGNTLPDILFKMEIPPIMNVISALLLSIFIGLGTVWTKSEDIARLLNQFQQIVLKLINHVLLPLLPLFVAANMCILSYQGEIDRFTVFFPVLIIMILMDLTWMPFIYFISTLYSRKNGWSILKHYAPAYFTAVGTMSSAATLGVALECAHKNSVLDRKVTDFGVPLFSNIHLCGSVINEVFILSVVSQLLYGHMPAFETYAVFIFLLAIFSVGAPGAPGGTVFASLGLVTGMLGFDETGTALLVTIYSLIDSFGTACNVTCDGALTLIVNKWMNKRKLASLG